VQSTACLVLAAQGRLDFPVFLFCNLGEDAEHPATLRYLREVAMPYATAHGIQLEKLRRIRRDGTPETLYGRPTRPGSRSLPIPVRMPDTGAPGTRSCTADFKIAVVAVGSVPIAPPRTTPRSPAWDLAGRGPLRACASWAKYNRAGTSRDDPGVVTHR
jgi:hypothetical protein